MSEENKENKEKTYCGSGKKITPTWFKATLKPEVLNEFIEEYKGHKFVRVAIQILEKPNMYGKDVQITIDKYEKTPPLVENHNEADELEERVREEYYNNTPTDAPKEPNVPNLFKDDEVDEKGDSLIDTDGNRVPNPLHSTTNNTNESNPFNT